MAVDKAGRYDESELIALNETDVSGGTGIGCATVSLASALSIAACPTFKCTSVDGGCGS